MWQDENKSAAYLRKDLKPMNFKKKILGTVAVCLAALMLPIGALAAFSSNLLQNPTYELKQSGFSYYEQTVSEGGTQKIFYGEYDTTAEDAEYEWVIHSNRNGNKTTLTTVMDLAKDYEQQTGRKVMYATNGDYFDFGSGSNMESYVNDGIVISKGSFATKHCIGFDNNGKVVVGRMTEVERRLMVVLNGQRYFFEIEGYNVEPSENGITIYTNPGEHTITGAGKYICGTTSTNLNQCPVWGTSRRMSTGTVTDDKPFTLRSSQFAVVVRGEHAQFFYDNIEYDVEVNLVEIPAGDFAGCTWVLGGYDILVDNGTVNTNCHTDNSGNANAPRTFIGFKPDGTGFLCVVDGRGAGGSTGVTVNKEAQLAKALGAQYALELDGGGSSTVIVRINDTLTLRTVPSDGSMRRVSNAIMLVEKVKEETPVEPEVPDTQPTQPTQPAEPTQTTPATSTPTTNTNNSTENTNTDSNEDNGVTLIIIGAVAAAVAVGTVVLILSVKAAKKRR